MHYLLPGRWWWTFSRWMMGRKRLLVFVAGRSRCVAVSSADSEWQTDRQKCQGRWVHLQAGRRVLESWTAETMVRDSPGWVGVPVQLQCHLDFPVRTQELPVSYADQLSLYSNHSITSNPDKMFSLKQNDWCTAFASHKETWGIRFNNK